MTKISLKIIYICKIPRGQWFKIYALYNEQIQCMFNTGTFIVYITVSVYHLTFSFQNL